jgi:hypothetical protein
MGELLFPQWRNENDHGKYPFSPTAELSNGTVILPENLFADARLYPIGGTQDQYLSKIVKSDTEVTFYVSDPTNGELATGVYDMGAPSERGVVQLQDLYGRAAGVFVTDANRMLPMLGWVSAEYVFTLEQSNFVPGVIVPMPRTVGVRSLRVDDTSHVCATDDVFIVGGRGVVLECAREGTDIVITVNSVGEPLYKQLLCQGLSYSNPCKLKTINGLKPDYYGNFQIVPCCLEVDRTVLRVVPINNGIRITVAGQ